ncbi:MAG: dihydroorotase [Planctomycetota bacterium]|nr:dihydroorotase [Planctomycetota bacterium]
MKWLLKGARVVDPARDLDTIADVRIERGAIAKVGRRQRADGAKTVDLSGCVICPGFFDMHVHLREPGHEWKETIESGTRAAARGGFTAVACMANTEPVNDCRSVTQTIVEEARDHGHVHVHPIGAVTKGLLGRELAEMDEMRQAGAVAFSDDGKPIMSSLTMRKALEYARLFDVPIIDHCEDADLVDHGVMHEGERSTRLGLRGWPGPAEDIQVQRDILLARYVESKVHIAHLSTAQAVDFVRRGKRAGVRVSCEVTPHHLFLTDGAVGEYDTNAKMNPPLREDRDRKALIKAVVDGTVDAIATDHAPHHDDEKCVEFSCAPFGIVGLETAVSLCLDRLVQTGKIPLSRLIELFTSGPRRVLGIPGGTIEAGAPADLTVLDLDREVEVRAGDFASLSANSPFLGWTLRGAPVLTMVGGRIAWRDR